MLKTIFIIISGILILYLLLRLRSLHRAIHTMTLELKEMNREEPVHRHLQIPVPDKELELLAEEINRYLTQSFSRSYAQKSMSRMSSRKSPIFPTTCARLSRAFWVIWN